HFGHSVLHPHLVFVALGYFLAFRIYQLMRYQQGDPVAHQTRWSVIAAAALGGAVGSKLLYWLEDPVQTIHRWRDMDYMMSGKTVVGGLIGGLVAVEVAKWLAGEKTRTGDLF